MNCQDCLTALPQGAAFCTHCGLSQIADPRVAVGQVSQHPDPRAAAGQITQIPFPPASVNVDEPAQVQAQHVFFSFTGKVPIPVNREQVAGTLRAGLQEGEKKEPAEREKEDENERLMVFSDGIIAFALTVAAITIKIPASVEQLQANSTSIVLRCVMYIIAFAIVASAWADHHAIFHHIKRNNIVLIALNFFYLAATILFPIGLFFLEFGAELEAVDSKVATSQILLGLGVFLGSQISAGLALVWMWKYANTRSRLVEEQLEPRFISYMARRLLSKPLLYILAVLFISIGGASPAQTSLTLLGVFLGILIVRAIYFRTYRRGLDLTIGSTDTGRIQLFSDAVIGIAITLAVAQIEFPTLGENSKGALEAVDHQWPLLHAFLVGIVIMGVYWFFHYQLFRFIERHDNWLIWLNCMFLLSITLMLVPINWFVNYYDKPGMYADFFFSFWQILTSLVLASMWWHVSRKKRLLVPGIAEGQIKHFGIMVSANPLIFLVLLLITAFVPTIAPSIYIVLYLVLIGATWFFSRMSMKQAVIARERLK